MAGGASTEALIICTFMGLIWNIVYVSNRAYLHQLHLYKEAREGAWTQMMDPGFGVAQSATQSNQLKSETTAYHPHMKDNLPSAYTALQALGLSVHEGTTHTASVPKPAMIGGTPYQFETQRLVYTNPSRPMDPSESEFPWMQQTMWNVCGCTDGASDCKAASYKSIFPEISDPFKTCCDTKAHLIECARGH